MFMSLAGVSGATKTVLLPATWLMKDATGTPQVVGSWCLWSSKPTAVQAVVFARAYENGLSQTDRAEMVGTAWCQIGRTLQLGNVEVVLCSGVRP